nr:N-acetylmuramoyl-L-alanine amidase [uncultured Niameybacter sp.]
MIKNKHFLIFSFLLISICHFPLQAMTLQYDEQTYEYTLPPITLFMEQNTLETPTMPPIQLGNVTLVPLKEILESLNATYEWKNFEKKIYIYYEDTLMVIEIDKLDVWVNGETIKLQTPAKIINNKVMVPLRFLSEQMGCTVEWIGGDKREIHITKAKPSKPSMPTTPLEPSLPSEPTLPNVPSLPSEPTSPNLPSENVPDYNLPTIEFKNIEYKALEYPLIKLSKKDGLKLNQLTFVDAYRERQLIIDLGGDYEFIFEDGQATIQDSYIKSIQTLTNQTTQIIITETKVQAYNIHEDKDYIYIELIPPYEKYDRILFLDPGHGGSHPGSGANGVVEKDLNLKQALALKSLLEQDGGIKVYMSREDDSNHFSTVRDELLYRTQLANEIGAHLFVSMHNNSGPSQVSGTETFYYADDSLSKQIATLTQQNIINTCNTTDRKAKPTKDLFVLLNTTMPGILIETGFVSNETEALLLQSDTFNEHLAFAVSTSILESFNLLMP